MYCGKVVKVRNMLSLKAEKREIVGSKINNLREQGLLPGVLYGPKIKNINLKLNQKDFEKTYEQAGESSLISLDVDGEKYSVLIYEVSNESIKGNPEHVDFYQPILTEKVEANVPIIFEGESPAIKDLGGTLVKEIQEILIKALPEKLPREIKVDVSQLKELESEILVKDLNLEEGVETDKEPEEIVAIVMPPEKVEEELEKPIEEKVEEVEDVEEEKEEEKPASAESSGEAKKEESDEKE